MSGYTRHNQDGCRIIRDNRNLDSENERKLEACIEIVESMPASQSSTLKSKFNMPGYVNKGFMFGANHFKDKQDPEFPKGRWIYSALCQQNKDGDFELVKNTFDDNDKSVFKLTQTKDKVILAGLNKNQHIYLPKGNQQYIFMDGQMAGQLGITLSEKKNRSTIAVTEEGACSFLSSILEKGLAINAQGTRAMAINASYSPDCKESGLIKVGKYYYNLQQEISRNKCGPFAIANCKNPFHYSYSGVPGAHIDTHALYYLNTYRDGYKEYTGFDYHGQSGCYEMACERRFDQYDNRWKIVALTDDEKAQPIPRWKGYGGYRYMQSDHDWYISNNADFVWEYADGFHWLAPPPGKPPAARPPINQNLPVGRRDQPRREPPNLNLPNPPMRRRQPPNQNLPGNPPKNMEEMIKGKHPPWRGLDDRLQEELEQIEDTLPATDLGAPPIYETPIDDPSVPPWVSDDMEDIPLSPWEDTQQPEDLPFDDGNLPPEEPLPDFTIVPKFNNRILDSTPYEGDMTAPLPVLPNVIRDGKKPKVQTETGVPSLHFISYSSSLPEGQNVTYDPALLTPEEMNDSYFEYTKEIEEGVSAEDFPIISDDLENLDLRTMKLMGAKRSTDSARSYDRAEVGKFITFAPENTDGTLQTERIDKNLMNVPSGNSQVMFCPTDITKNDNTGSLNYLLDMLLHRDRSRLTFGTPGNNDIIISEHEQGGSRYLKLDVSSIDGLIIDGIPNAPAGISGHVYSDAVTNAMYIEP